MNRLKASTIALIAIGAAIIGLGAAVVLTMPKDAWSSIAAFHGGRFTATGADGGRAGENSAEAVKDSAVAAYPPCLPYRGAMDGYGRGLLPFGRPMHGGGHGPGGIVMLALLVGAAIGCAAFRKNKLAAKEDK
jgi:hypothetical protein